MERLNKRFLPIYNRPLSPKQQMIRQNPNFLMRKSLTASRKRKIILLVHILTFLFLT